MRGINLVFWKNEKAITLVGNIRDKKTIFRTEATHILHRPAFFPPKRLQESS